MTGALLLILFAPCFFIDDGKQGGQLCCQINGHLGRSSLHHHRSCDCLYKQSDDPDVIECWTFLLTATINHHASLHGLRENLCQLSICKCGMPSIPSRWGTIPISLHVCSCWCDAYHSAWYDYEAMCLIASRNVAVCSHWQSMTRWLTYLTQHSVILCAPCSLGLTFQRINKPQHGGMFWAGSQGLVSSFPHHAIGWLGIPW